MLPALMLVVATSTNAREVYQPAETSTPRPTEAETRQLARAELVRAQQERWDADRRLRVTIGAAWGVAVVDRGTFLSDDEHGPLRAVLSLGLRTRLAPEWELQSRLGVELALIRVSAMDLEVTIRRGVRRFYLGVGPMMRTSLPHRFEEVRTPFAIGGGGVLEMGWLIGHNRDFDFSVRARAGALPIEDQKPLFVEVTVGVSWCFPQM